MMGGWEELDSSRQGRRQQRQRRAVHERGSAEGEVEVSATRNGYNWRRMTTKDWFHPGELPILKGRAFRSEEDENSSCCGIEFAADFKYLPSAGITRVALV
jgi:hypothetical protein